MPPRPFPRLDELLAAADGEPAPRVDELATTFEISESRVYAILRDHRPDRARTPRTETSELPARIKAMRARLPNATKARIAELLNTSRQYVHRVLGPKG